MSDGVLCETGILIRYGSFDTKEMMEESGRDRLCSAINDFNNIEQKIRIMGAYAYYDHNIRRLNVTIDRIERQDGACAFASPDEIETFMRATEKNLKTLLTMRYGKSSVKVTSTYDINEI